MIWECMNSSKKRCTPKVVKFLTSVTLLNQFLHGELLLKLESDFPKAFLSCSLLAFGGMESFLLLF